MIMTTNRTSPIVFLPSLLPHSLKELILARLYAVEDKDIFPTHHRFNTPGKIKSGIPGFRLIRLQFIEQVPLERPGLMSLFAPWYFLTKIPLFRHFRTNMLAVFLRED